MRNPRFYVSGLRPEVKYSLVTGTQGQPCIYCYTQADALSHILCLSTRQKLFEWPQLSTLLNNVQQCTINYKSFSSVCLTQMHIRYVYNTTLYVGKWWQEWCPCTDWLRLLATMNNTNTCIFTQSYHDFTSCDRFSCYQLPTEIRNWCP